MSYDTTIFIEKQSFFNKNTCIIVALESFFEKNNPKEQYTKVFFSNQTIHNNSHDKIDGILISLSDTSSNPNQLKNTRMSKEIARLKHMENNSWRLPPIKNTHTKLSYNNKITAI